MSNFNKSCFMLVGSRVNDDIPNTFHIYSIFIICIRIKVTLNKGKKYVTPQLPTENQAALNKRHCIVLTRSEARAEHELQ